MNLHEKDAIVEYVEFLLTNLIELVEENCDPDVLGEVYERASQVSEDLEHTLMTQALYDNPDLLAELTNIRATQKKR